MKVGDLVRFKWQEWWEGFGTVAPQGKKDWHERYDTYYGIVYSIDACNRGFFIRFPDKSILLPAKELEVISKCQKN